MNLENLSDFYIFKEVSKGNKNFRIFLNSDLARRLYELELTSNDINNLKNSFMKDNSFKTARL